MRVFHCLLLQASDNFEQLAHGRSFATGENVLNGIAIYSPTSPAYLQRLFGHGNYVHFLFEGLTHELMHVYTTKAWQGKFKSRLYPAVECPALHARMIGGDLNVYFCLQGLYLFLEKPEAFLPETVGQALSKYLQTRQRNPLLDLFLFDIALRHNKRTLLQVFGALVEAQQIET